jgi:hypothetical protein
LERSAAGCQSLWLLRDAFWRSDLPILYRSARVKTSGLDMFKDMLFPILNYLVSRPQQAPHRPGRWPVAWQW